MPTYDYQDERGHKASVTMTYAVYDAIKEPFLCSTCGQPMKRVYHVVPVNWNGLPPHEADARPPIINKFINDTPERRSRYLDTKEDKHAS